MKHLPATCHLVAPLLALTLLASCAAPDQPATPPARPAPVAAAPVVPDVAAAHAFLRATSPLRMGDYYGVEGSDGEFFLRQPYGLDTTVANKLVPVKPNNVPGRMVVDDGFAHVPAAVLRDFRQQVLHLDTAAQRRFTWQPAQLPWFVLVDSTGQQLPPALASEVARPSPARQQALTKAIAEWNKLPQAERFISYASVPLFSPDGRYVLMVRGQSQQSIGWDSIFIYERTPKGWKIVEGRSLTTI